MKRTMLLAVLLTLGLGFSGANLAGDKVAQPKAQQEEMKCEAKAVEVVLPDGRTVVAQTYTCSKTCSQGTATTQCRPNEKCHCECRSSGLAGCSCHPTS